MMGRGGHLLDKKLTLSKVGTTSTKGNPVSGKWQRYIASKAGAEDKAKYDLMTSRPLRAKFREDWARKKYESHVMVFQQVTKETRTYWKRSTYMGYARLAVEEGGGKLGVIQAIKETMYVADSDRTLRMHLCPITW